MCNNCIHKIVCSKYIACGEVKTCEHFKEERWGEWVKSPNASGSPMCSRCFAVGDRDLYCGHCGADMRGEEDENT